MNFEDYFKFLNQVSPISRADFQLIENAVAFHTFKKNEIVIRPGQIQRQAYFLLEGLLMSYLDGDSKIHVQAFAYPPGLAAIPQSFVNQSPSTHFLQAMSETRVAEISFEDLQAALSQSHALESLFRKLTEQMLIGVLNKNTEMYSLSMEQRYRAFTRRSPHLLQLVSHKYIASYLNIDATNFSKLYNSIVI